VCVCVLCVEHGAAVSGNADKSFRRESPFLKFPPWLQRTLSLAVFGCQVTRPQPRASPTHQEAVTVCISGSVSAWLQSKSTDAEMLIVCWYY